MNFFGFAKNIERISQKGAAFHHFFGALAIPLINLS
jgi:hypothetical protein